MSVIGQPMVLCARFGVTAGNGAPSVCVAAFTEIAAVVLTPSKKRFMPTTGHGLADSLWNVKMCMPGPSGIVTVWSRRSLSHAIVDGSPDRGLKTGPL